MSFLSPKSPAGYFRKLRRAKTRAAHCTCNVYYTCTCTQTQTQFPTTNGHEHRMAEIITILIIYTHMHKQKTNTYLPQVGNACVSLANSCWDVVHLVLFYVFLMLVFVRLNGTPTKVTKVTSRQIGRANKTSFVFFFDSSSCPFRTLLTFKQKNNVKFRSR